MFKIIFWLVGMVVFWLTASGCAVRTDTDNIEAGLHIEQPKPDSAKGNPAPSGAGGKVPDKACEPICAGKLDVAWPSKREGQADSRIPVLEKIVNEYMGISTSPDWWSFISEWPPIVNEYMAINARRQSAREAAYKEQMDELRMFEAEKSRRSRKLNIDDVNDVNDVTTRLTVIAKLWEFADEQHRGELLAEPFVKRTMEETKAMAAELAAEFETKADWIEAYSVYYSWLQVIEPNNKSNSDYCEQLWDRANIVASFQDSPCETSKERYAGVRKELFFKAVDVLNSNYVGPVEYRPMASKAVKRCELLADVIGVLSRLKSASGEKGDANSPQNKKLGLIKNLKIPPPGSREVAAWSAGLGSIMGEISQSPIGINKDRFIEVFERVVSLNESTIQLPQEILIAQFAEAAFSALDPYTVMIWPRQVEDFEKTMTNEFTGIGIEITKEKGLLTVASLLPDTPAYNSGLDAGDVIEVVDKLSTKDMSLPCAVKHITGPAGTKVTLTIKRSGEPQSRDITITRDKIIVHTIRGWKRTETGKWLYMIDEQNKIGYVRITNFSEKTNSDLEKVLVQLEAEGMKGLVLDLRFNAGGLLNSAVDVVDEFVSEGLIVSTRPRFGVWTYSTAKKQGTHPNYSLIVLINAGSASASEIVAGSLADPQHKRAILVGERTHGKGSVQSITQLPGGGAQLKYTMAYYYLPSGQRVENQDEMKKRNRKDWGVRPNVEVKLRTDEIKRMIDVQRDNDVLVKAGHNGGGSSLKKHTLEETLAADPQLAVGVLIVRSRLAQPGSQQLIVGAN